jgi:hypothetical protein
MSYMTFKLLGIDNSDLHKESIYNAIKNKSLEEFKNLYSNIITEHEFVKDTLIETVYNYLDTTHDSITFYLKTTTIYEDKDYLLQMMHVSDDDIFHAKLYNDSKYKFNYLGKLVINSDDNVNGKFVIFGYKINNDNTYEFCDMTKELLDMLIIQNLFKTGIMIDLDEMKEILIDQDFNLYDKEFKSINMNINKVQNHDYNDENIANFKLGIVTPYTDDEYHNDILVKLTNNYKFKGEVAYIFSYMSDKNYNCLDNLSLDTFNKLLKTNKNKDYSIPNHDKNIYIYNKFTMLDS